MGPIDKLLSEAPKIIEKNLGKGSYEGFSLEFRPDHADEKSLFLTARIKNNIINEELFNKVIITKSEIKEKAKKIGLDYFLYISFDFDDKIKIIDDSYISSARTRKK